MDLNLAVIAGTLSAPPEIRTFGSGARLARYLVIVRSTEPRRRTDVLPVTEWEPAVDSPALHLERGDRIWAVATVQRRFWSAAEGRRSKIEVIAHYVESIPTADEADLEQEAG